MKVEKTLGENLKSAREEKHFSQEYVAGQLNISRQAISKWENGKGYPDLDNLILLSKLYGVSIDTLTNNERTKKDTESTKVSFVDEQTIAAQHEMLLLAVLITISCFFTVIGILVPIGVLIWMKKNHKPYKIIVFLAIACILISCYNAFSILNVIFFDIGESSIEKL